MPETSFPSSPSLSVEAARALLESAFRLRPEDRSLALIVDLPDARLPDRPAWAERRSLAVEWRRTFAQALGEGFEVALFAYPNVRTNNAELPERAWPVDGELPATSEDLDDSAGLAFEQVFRDFDLLMAPTELSTTAPLKLAARRFGFRAATMPRFSRAMVPALGLDFAEIDRRCRHLKELLDRAEGADIQFRADGCDYRLYLDLRHRTAHASSGLLAEPGMAGNLPSGETYIVPYEGEVEGDPSRSEGFLPVQLDDGHGGTDVVIYRVLENRAIGVREGGQAAEREAEHLKRDPAYGNIAELGLGVLSAFGIEPIGEILLDEKLGPHIAFGRSDHFGGQVGPGDFASPDSVVHIDRVYLPSSQPRVRIERLDLVGALPANSSGPLTLIRAGEWAFTPGEDR